MKLILILTLISIVGVYKCASLASLKFGVLADWGGLPIFPYKTFVELSVGREMDYFASIFGMDAILALGDNFYFDGVKDVADPRFKETFELAFNYKSLHIPWLVIAGNHDHYGNVSAQLAYSALSDRWYFPHLYYMKRFLIPYSNITMELIMIDTVILCGNTDPEYPEKQPVLDSFGYERNKHWLWLEETLKTSKSNYLLVAGHYPVYSIGTHGPTDCLVSNLKPLLEKYNVTVYLSGHDHNIQHIQVKNGGKVMDYVVTGSANFIDPSRKNLHKIPPNSLQFHWGDPFSLGAFTYIDATPSTVNISFYLTSGKLLHSFTKEPRWT
ncbi:tartrate-resistant acid phosphatase type 5 isoform X1 [Parasteatoda tepidariorum]|uniref:tartrate-resistant acid phosphatase type 5 isoform X1 n=2 Tax=Parasteatoda tepidariorum TaxID=114398 RepID=UPI001C71BF8B|nr:tartrate-resistant acid phosphatase type 5 isoform X1 [Parasteatoda tepidariorum]XP_042896037.1 tartrate-resistant acid phosphatase type 5 isoform X1 [Parasteatoda tepidariorum]